jgi:Ser/Thr protein kinase RdoA (MazF antagonist)
LVPLIETVRDNLGCWLIGDLLKLAEIHHAGTGGRAFRIETTDGSWVAKVAYDRVHLVAPGLAIAERVASHGISTGPPLRTSTDELAIPLRRGPTEWTLALLLAEPGTPIDLDDPATPERLGRLLAEVHVVLAAVTQRSDVPARLLEWWHQFALDRSNTASLEVLDHLERLGVDELPHSVIYGDPSPEVLDNDGRLALIDWGTPSWGPQVHDLACWSAFVGSGAERLVASYDEVRKLSQHERELLEFWRPLVASIVENA